jgi:hypothetical protein
MRIIKLYEDFTQDEARKLEQDINDILVELGDSGFKYKVNIIKMNIERGVTHFNQVSVDIFKEVIENREDDDYKDFQVSEIYEPVMTLIGFMRDKYPDIDISYDLTVYDDYDKETIDEFLEENDFESIENYNETPLSVTDIVNFEIKFSNNEV